MEDHMVFLGLPFPLSNLGLYSPVKGTSGGRVETFLLPSKLPPQCSYLPLC
jgi:hypothetical protein